MLGQVLAAAALVLPAAQAQQELTLRPFASGLSAVTAIASTPAEPRRLYAVEQVGRIRYFVNGKLRGTFLDIRDRVVSGGEQGLLSVAFHPGYARNHRFYVNYTDKSGNTRVVEFRSRNGLGIKSTARQLLFVRQPDAFGALGLALNATEEPNGIRRDELGQIRELLEAARDLWRTLPEAEDDGERRLVARTAVRLIQIADTVAVTSK